MREGTPGRPIVLVGPMAAGKSVVGAELARVLGVDFLDTDHLIAGKHGPIADLFASRGEHYFRRLEAKAVADVLDAPPRAVVLSLGGGAVLDSGTQQLLRKATVVYLKTDLDTVRERISRNTGRPLLAGDPLAAWSRLAAVRAPVYERLATITLEAGHADVATLVARLVDLLGAEAKEREPGTP